MVPTVTDARLHVTTAEKVRLLERARVFRRQPTASEMRLWQALRRDTLGVPVRRQQVIGPFIVDFFVPRYGLIIEVDGPVHEDQHDRDRERDGLLEACGYQVLRMTAEAVDHDLESVVDRIRSAFATTPSASVTPLHP